MQPAVRRLSYLPLARALSVKRALYWHRVSISRRSGASGYIGAADGARLRSVDPGNTAARTVYQLLGHSPRWIACRAAPPAFWRRRAAKSDFSASWILPFRHSKVGSARDPGSPQGLHRLPPHAAAGCGNRRHFFRSPGSQRPRKSISVSGARRRRWAHRSRRRHSELPQVTLRPEKVVTAFIIYQRLSAINRQPATLAPRVGRCTGGREHPRSRRSRLAQSSGLRQAVHEHDEIRASHEDIVKCPEFLATLAEGSDDGSERRAQISTRRCADRRRS